MRIIHLTNTEEGGAGIAVKRTHLRLKELGYESILIVKKDVRDTDNIFKLFYTRIRNKLIKPEVYFDKYCFFSKYELLKQNNYKLLSKINDGDVLIFYWLGDEFINLNTINEIIIKKNVKIFWYSVDMAPFTGGCHYFWNCTGYTKKCEECPAVLTGKKSLPARQFAFKKEIAKKIEINILASSNTGLTLMKKSNILYSKYSLLPYAINTEIFNLSKFNLENKNKKIFFNAQNVTDPRKGYNLLVEIILELNKLLLNTNHIIEFMCVNNVNSFKHLESQNLRFINYDKPKDSESALAYLYSQSDLFLCTSIEDLSPLMVNEALLCGIPVITFNNASNSEYIMNGENGILIEKYETTLFAKSIFDYISAKYSFSDAIEIRNSVLHIHEKNNWNKIFKKNIYG